MKIGVLALQGCIDPHLKQFERCNISCIKVRSPEDLAQVQGLVMPGGESTTMLKLLIKTGLDQAITEFAKNKPIWGICAGSILIAKEVINPKQRSLGLIDILAERNHYGSQLESFTTELSISCIPSTQDKKIEVAFIRAPLLSPLDPLNKNVEILASHNNQTIMLRQKNIIVSSFHAELGSDPRLHQYFSEFCK